MIAAAFFLFKVAVWLVIISGALLLLLLTTNQQKGNPSGLSELFFLGAPALVLLFKAAELVFGFSDEGLHFFRSLELLLTICYFAFFASAFALSNNVIDAAASNLDTGKYFIYALATNALLAFVFLVLVGTLRAGLFHFDSSSYELNEGARAAFVKISSSDRRDRAKTLQSCRNLRDAVNSTFGSADMNYVIPELRASKMVVKVTIGRSGRQTEIYESGRSYPSSEGTRGPCTIRSSGAIRLGDLRRRLNGKIDALEAYLEKPLIYRTNAITFAFLSALDIFTINDVEVVPKSSSARFLDFFANWMVIFLGVLLVDCIKRRNRVREIGKGERS